MHYLTWVALPPDRPGTDRPGDGRDLEAEVAFLLAPYDENLEFEPFPEAPDEMWNPNGKWDWWVIGGRWEGVFSGANHARWQFVRDESIAPEALWIPLPAALVIGEQWIGGLLFDDEKEEAKARMAEELNRLPDDAILVAVDCHT